MSIVLNSSGGGSITINEPTTASNFTHTLPAATGDVMVSGNMPAFSAYSASNQTVTANTFTKVILATEEFDTNSNFASSTFTPTVAGYYQVSGCIQFNTTVSLSRAFVQIYKNGSAFKYLTDIAGSASRVNGSCLIYMNGTTDNIELYGFMNGAGTLTFDSGSLGTYFQATLVRAA